MKMKKNTLIALTVVFTVLFAVSTFFIANHFHQEKKSQGLYDGLADAVTEAVEISELTEPIQFSEEKTIIPEYAKLYQENENMVGWISVPGTKINYPVVQTPNEPNYYLRRGFDGEYAVCGCPYVQEDCDVNKPSDNIVIYGHNMRNGTMFGELDKFESKDFWKEHKTLSFNTLTDKQEYEIVAVFKTFVYSDSPDAFKYYRFINAESEDEFDAFMERCEELALYDTDVEAEYGDKLVTLSTCEYSRANGRLVLVAKQVSECNELGAENRG